MFLYRYLMFFLNYRPREGNVFTPVCHSVHREGFCPRGVSVLGGGLCPGGCLCPEQGVSVQGGMGLCQEDPSCTVTCGRYASYWNTFLLKCFSGIISTTNGTYPQIVGEHEGKYGDTLVVIATSYRSTNIPGH